MKTLRKPTAGQEKQLQAWRALALSRMPYFASMLFSLRPLDAPGLGTFAVDYTHRLYVDFEAVAEHGDEFCAQGLLHECLHVLCRHDEVAEKLNVDTPNERRVFNVAADMSINDDLVEAGCDKLEDFGAVLPKLANLPDWQTSMFYYRELLDKQPDDPDRQNDGGNDEQDYGQAESGDGQSEPFAGCGSGSGGQTAPVELGPDDDFGGVAPAASMPERERVAVQTAEAVKDYASKRPGSVPAGLREFVDAVFAPSKIPWRRTLSVLVRRFARIESGNQDTSFTRRNRRHHARMVRDPSTGASKKIMVPGWVSPVPSVHVVRDTSGSMSEDELSMVTSEVEGIARKLRIRGDDLVVADVDTEVAGARRYRSIRDLAEVNGRGGTDMSVGIVAADGQRKKPSVIVVITDGMTPWPQKPVRTPVVACLVGSRAEKQKRHVPDWITTLVVD